MNRRRFLAGAALLPVVSVAMAMEKQDAEGGVFRVHADDGSFFEIKRDGEAWVMKTKEMYDAEEQAHIHRMEAIRVNDPGVPQFLFNSEPQTLHFEGIKEVRL